MSAAAVSVMAFERKPNRHSSQRRNAEVAVNKREHTRDFVRAVIDWCDEKQEEAERRGVHVKVTDLAAAHFGIDEAKVDCWLVKRGRAYEKAHRATRTGLHNAAIIGGAVLQQTLGGLF